MGRVVRSPRRPPASSGERPGLLLARIELAEGDVEAAEKSARSALQTLESHGLADRPAAGGVHVALGAVVARLGETQEAGDALVRGLARLRRHGEVLEIADALLVYAPVRRALESLTSAREPRRGGSSSPCGVRRPRSRRRGARGGRPLAHSGPSAHRRGERADRARSSRCSATWPTECRSGTSDRALFLSYNTIHSHTKSIYQKLRVSSRDAAVARARELGAL